MSIIDAVGLFHGERLRRCSNAARLHWPYLFLASNGFGRLEIDYHRIVATAFASFRPIPTEQELMGHLREYSDAHLLFLYRAADGAVWGQWDCKPQRLNKYKTACDRRSPAPPEPAFADWQSTYANGLTKTIPVSLTDISENLPQILGSLPKHLHKISRLEMVLEMEKYIVPQSR